MEDNHVLAHVNEVVECHEYNHTDEVEIEETVAADLTVAHLLLYNLGC
jgi:hypothetical protein